MSKSDDDLIREPVGSVLYDLVREALASECVEASEHTEHYLLNLLSAFARTDAGSLSEALGPAYLSATSLDPAARYVKVKQVADTSLFLSGVFLDYVEAQLPATEYFFDIGASAYLYLGSVEDRRLTSSDPLFDTYRDLGSRFAEFAHVLASISDAELFPSNKRMLSLYSRWLRDGTTRDERRLLAHGLIPVRGDDDTRH